jgi:hypothetical protein
VLEELKKIGIDVGLLTSGLFGAILLVSRNSAENLRTTVLSIVGGAASANYVTPIVLDILKINTERAGYGIAFLLGFLGLKGVEILSEKVFGKNIVKEMIDEPKTKRKTTKKKTTRNSTSRSKK